MVRSDSLSSTIRISANGAGGEWEGRARSARRPRQDAGRHARPTRFFGQLVGGFLRGAGLLSGPGQFGLGVADLFLDPEERVGVQHVAGARGVQLLLELVDPALDSGLPRPGLVQGRPRPYRPTAPPRGLGTLPRATFPGPLRFRVGPAGARRAPALRVRRGCRLALRRGGPLGPLWVGTCEDPALGRLAFASLLLPPLALPSRGSG